MRISLLLLVVSVFAAACQTAPKQAIDSKASVASGITEMSPAEARPGVEAAYSQLVDVREPAEFASGHAYRARNIPLGTLAANLDKLERNEPVYLICQTSNRSREAAKVLAGAGFERVVVISGGTNAWRDAGLPMENPKQ